MKKHVLIVTTIRWLSAAQLAIAFRDVGWSVDVVCPSGHPVTLTAAVNRTYRFRPFRPLRSLRIAIAAAQPALVIPMDDLAAAHLHRLQQRISKADGALSALLMQSLGEPEAYAAIEARALFAAVAVEQGVTVPPTECPEDQAALLSLLKQARYPLVLKVDGTSGGEGVRIADCAEEALRHYRSLRRPLSASSVALRLLLDRNLNVLAPWMLRKRRKVNVQSFVRGRDANIAVACWQGELLAGICVEALHTRSKHGPSAVVRVINSESMREAARRIVSRLGFSGLCGFDFVLEETTGEPVLIEINGRATPTCHLALGPGLDLVAALCSAASGHASRERPPVTTNPILGLFPLSWQIDPTSQFLAEAYRDLPADEPELVRVGLAKPRRPTRAQWRLFRTRVSLSSFRSRVIASERLQ